MNPLSETERSPSVTESERVFDKGEHYFNALIEAINLARSCIKLEVYIFEDDSLGKAVSDALIRARARNVKVRIILDAIGSYRGLECLSRSWENAGIEVRVYHPLPWQLNHYPRSLKQGGTLDKALFFLRKINRRDHRKLCVIDHHQLFTGSFNISAVHLPREQGGDHWRDFGAELCGARVADIEQQFDVIWQRQPDSHKHRKIRHYLANISDWARTHKNLAFEQLIVNADNKIWLTSAYFAPSSRVIRAFKYAVRRGVEICIIVPARSDIHLFPFLTATYYKDLLNSGIKVFEYQPRVLHAKLLIVDQQCILGSTNFNHRSFLHDLELDIFLIEPSSLHTLESAFKHDLTHCIALNSTASNSSAKNWLLQLLSKTLRYWM